MFVLLLIHLALGVGLLCTGDRLGRHAFTMGIIAPAATVAWAAVQWPSIVDGEAVEESVVWVQGLNISLDLRLDAFGLVMTALVSGIGLLVFIYSIG